MNLYEVIEMAEKHGFPVIVGTEMNAPGNKFVDNFAAAELQPLVPVFLKGAHIVYAHSRAAARERAGVFERLGEVGVRVGGGEERVF